MAKVIKFPIKIKENFIKSEKIKTANFLLNKMNIDFHIILDGDDLYEKCADTFDFINDTRGKSIILSTNYEKFKIVNKKNTVVNDISEL